MIIIENDSVLYILAINLYPFRNKIIHSTKNIDKMFFSTFHADNSLIIIYFCCLVLEDE